jgi:hypothetical protein
MINIKLTAGPANAEAVIREGLNHTHSNHDILLGHNPGALHPGMHHKVFDLDPHDIVAGKGLENVQLTGSRYLIADGRNGMVVAAAEIPANNSSTGLINNGPFVQGFANAVRFAESQPHHGDYTLHLLRSAPLYLMALWLKPSDAGDSVIIPLQPAPHFLGKPSYAEAEFLQALLAPAEELLARS